MANRKKIDGSSRVRGARRYGGDSIFSSSSSSDENDKLASSVRRSSRGSNSTDYGRIRVEINQQTASQDTSRREENPFSFRHFLRSESQTNYNKTGAKPKIYSSSASSPGSLEKDIGVYSRNPTELPDFVQDHLVIEQCYLNHESNQQTVADVDNLPDFALNSVEQRLPRHRNDLKKSQSQFLCDLPFDLTGSLDKDILHRNHSTTNNHVASSSSNADLSVHERPLTDSIERSESTGFPFDLPLPLAEPDSNVNTARDCALGTDANVPKSLPDFLSDGLIYNRTTLSNDIGSDSNIGESTERNFLSENEKLRKELDVARRQLNEKSIRIELLESELASRREVDHEETIHLEKAMEQVEDNLKRSTQRAINAESTVSSLEKEIKSLMTEISLLRLENMELRSAVGAVSEGNSTSMNTNSTVRKLASDLRNAASSAELSLRQLMSGVDNLRVLASALENVDRIEDRTKDFLPDFDEDNATGGTPL